MMWRIDREKVAPYGIAALVVSLVAGLVAADVLGSLSRPRRQGPRRLSGTGPRPRGRSAGTRFRTWSCSPR